MSDDQVRCGDHRQRDVPIPGVVAADLILVQAGLDAGVVKALSDRYSSRGHAGQLRNGGLGRPETHVVGDPGLVAVPGQKLGSFGFKAFPNQVLLGTPAVLGGYPGDKPFAELWGMRRKIKAATATTLVYDIDTMGGQSGAPLYIKHGGKRYVVGIHNYGAATGNSATRVTPAVMANFKKWATIGAGPAKPAPSAPKTAQASAKVAGEAPVEDELDG